MAETTRIIHPPERVENFTEPVVLLAGRDDEPLASQLRQSGYQMTIVTSSRPKSESIDAKIHIEDVSWMLHQLHSVLGGAGVLAVRLESVESISANDEHILSILEHLLRDQDLREELQKEMGRVILQIPLGYQGDISRAGIIASEANARVVTDNAELIVQILSRLPSPTNSIHS